LPVATPAPPSAISPLSLHDALPIYGTGLVVDESRNCRVDIDQQFVNATERRCTSGISYVRSSPPLTRPPVEEAVNFRNFGCISLDRKSTRLNSSHVKISYAVFCLKK